jgi:hypothetical protein
MIISYFGLLDGNIFVIVNCSFRVMAVRSDLSLDDKSKMSILFGPVRTARRCSPAKQQSIALNYFNCVILTVVETLVIW